ncbi:hypothetical protein CNR22_01770 [Sphingobacteriaceae bacterium]|nr:hypothetical protein CNR22_01770 [Sphingobacteriaceae bacterium]
MGIACCCVENPTFCGLEASDWINIIGVLVNAGLGLWVVLTIQSRATNRRILKDHFISEVKNIRDEYKEFLSKLYGNSIAPKTVVPWFKLMNVKAADLLNLLDQRYSIHKKMLDAYQVELRELITNSPEFNAQFNNTRLELSVDLQNKVIRFQQNSSYVFNHIITKINDAS